MATAGTPTGRLFDIAELVDLIGSYLETPELFHCVQVCQSWNRGFIPHLWDTIDDRRHAWPRILRIYDSDTAEECGQDEAWIVRIFAKYGQHIRHLNIHWKVIIKAASNYNEDVGVSCPNLRSLSISEVDTALTRHQKEIHSARSSFLPASGGVPYETRDQIAMTGPLLSPIFEKAFKPLKRGIRTEDQQLEEWVVVQQFWLLVQHNPQLQVLRIDPSLDELVAMNTSRFVDSMVMDKLTNLVDLRCQDLTHDFSALLCRFSSLRRVHSPVLLSGGALVGRFASLRYLRASRALSLADIVTLLNGLPNLEELTVAQIAVVEGHPTVIDTMDRTPSGLQSLSIDWSKREDAESLKTLSPWLPRLTKLAIGRLRYGTTSILGDYYPQLESLTELLGTTASRPGQIALESGVLFAVLERCRNLKTIDAKIHSAHMYRDTESVWVCQGLSTLCCQLRSINRLTAIEQAIYDGGLTPEAVEAATRNLPRDDDEYDEDDDDEVNPVQIQAKYLACQAQQMKVYNQLAGLKQLKSLQLGRPRQRSPSTWETERVVDDRPPVRDTLELSLVSGLDRLAALADLEKLGVEGVNHRIGRAELEWMAGAWPKLRVMRGLNDGRQSTRDLKDYMHQLRPDILFSDF
ncbi:hypothetical protein BGX33_005754 [Mortierella sp. NVP41]|nr:hypothetical protein BGX33_005754 [Mortierella sp. NVP41]